MIADNTFTRSRRSDVFWPTVLVVALATYSFFSSSTPDELGLPEAVIGLMLIMLTGMKSPLQAVGGFLLQGRNGVPKYVYWSFLYLLVVPSVVGLLLRNNDVRDFIRDVVPLLYFFLPIFLIPRMQENPRVWLNTITLGLCLVGTVFSVRHFLADEGGIEQLGRVAIVGDMNYFPQDPAVLFTASYLLPLGMSMLVQRKWVMSGLAFLAGLTAFLAIAGIVVRAQIVLVLGAIVFFALYVTWKARGAPLMWIAVALIVLILAPLYGVILDVIVGTYDLFLWKFQDVGVLNLREEETLEVLAYVTSSAFALLFGTGWGGIIDTTPSGLTRFVHNVFAYGLLKTGLLGLVAFVFYAAWIGGVWWRFTAGHIDSPMKMAFWLGVSNALFLNFTLEPGFKMLSLGLIIVAAVLALMGSVSRPRVETGSRPYLISARFLRPLSRVVK